MFNNKMLLNRIRPVLHTRVRARAPVFCTPRRHVCVRSLPLDEIAGGFDYNTITYFTGKSIILFTLFYCSLNWKYYRDLRKKMEGDDDSEGKDKNKGNKNQGNRNK